MCCALYESDHSHVNSFCSKVSYFILFQMSQTRSSNRPKTIRSSVSWAVTVWRPTARAPAQLLTCRTWTSSVCVNWIRASPMDNHTARATGSPITNSSRTARLMTFPNRNAGLKRACEWMAKGKVRRPIEKRNAIQFYQKLS